MIASSIRQIETAAVSWGVAEGGREGDADEGHRDADPIAFGLLTGSQAAELVFGLDGVGRAPVKHQMMTRRSGLVPAGRSLIGALKG